MSKYNLTNISFDSPPQWLTSLKEPLELSGVGVSIFNLPPGKGYTFMHAHEEQEEVYICLLGKGTALIGKEKIPLKQGDILRIDPEDRRAFRAGDNEPLVMICAGGVTHGYPKSENSRSLIDDGVPHFDDIPFWYEGNEKVTALVKKYD